jgi:hypothetical protein
MATFTKTKDSPLALKTPPGTAGFTTHAETKAGVAILVCTVGKTVLHYDARCIAARWIRLEDWRESNRKAAIGKY